MSKILFSLILLISVTVNASVITFPESIIVVSVNGVEQPSHFFAQQTTVELAEGDHILVLKYQDLFEGDDDHTNVKSKPFVLIFTLSQAQANNAINVATPILDELKLAKSFAKSPEVSLMDENSNEINSINESLLSFNAKSKFEQLTVPKTAKSNVVNNSTIVAHMNIAAKKACNGNEVENNSQLEQLKCLWQTSNKAEQEAFIYYILEQQFILKPVN